MVFGGIGGEFGNVLFFLQAGVTVADGIEAALSGRNIVFGQDGLDDGSLGQAFAGLE